MVQNYVEYLVYTLSSLIVIHLCSILKNRHFVKFEDEHKNNLQHAFHAYLKVTTNNNACKSRLVRSLLQ